MPHADLSGMAGKRFKKDLSGMPYAKGGAESSTGFSHFYVCVE
jgi:hypothetical protein